MNQERVVSEKTGPHGLLTNRQVIPLALLALLIVFHIANNWIWRDTNLVVFGFDRMFHQVSSLAYYDILHEGVNLHTLFAALTLSDYYPPLVHLTAVVFYSLFGVSMDVAAMSNSLYLVLLLLAVYDIGRRLGGPWVGLLSAFVLSTFPIVFSMSRYLYIDFGLMAMVAVNICLLLRSDGFRHRGTSLLYGFTLGLGLLIKWTFAPFAIGPLLFVVGQARVLGPALRALRPWTWQRRRFLGAALIGLVLTALWFVPNIEAVAALPLGFFLAPLSWLIWTWTANYILAKGEPGANLLAALGLGAAVASSWYLTKINFISFFWQTAYTRGTGRSWGFGPYADFLFREQLSPLYSAVLLVALAILVWHRWRWTRSLRGFLSLGLEGWVLVLWFGVSYTIFSSQVSIIHSRYTMSLLPPLAIAVALGLSRISRPVLRSGVIGLVAVLALFQFAALSFDILSPLQEQTALLASGLSIQLPSTGQTDSGYWVEPDILQYVQEHGGPGVPRLGILLNSGRINSKHFIYLTYREYPGVLINELASTGEDKGIYARLFESDFLLLFDVVEHYPRRPEFEATLARILTTEDDTFHRAYQLVQTYPLPDGTHLDLYQQRFDRLRDVDTSYYQSLMADLERAALPGDAIVVAPPEQIYTLARYGSGSVPLYPLPSEPGQVTNADLAQLESLGAEHRRLWLVLGEGGTADPAGVLMPGLAERFYRAGDAWYGPVERLLYAPPAGQAAALDFQNDPVTWEPGITLLGYRFAEPSVPLGQIVRLDLSWQATQPLAESYKVFIHLLDEGGQLVSQRDSEPVAGLLPTTSWPVGEPVADRYGLVLPADLLPGEYRLILGFYQPETGERLTTCCPAADTVLLARVYVDGGKASLLPASGN